MPFLRTIRDKRGYETTYLMHWYRDGHRQRSRILYVFRTPGGVRVGRDAMEPDVLRTIEAQYPDIEFEWKTIVDNKQLVEPPPVDLRRPRKRRRPEDEEDAPAEKAVVVAAPAPPAAPRSEPAVPAPPSRPPIPSAIQGATPEEQIVFLTTWYPAVRDRIPHRTADAARQEALLALAERLNPAAWTDADQIAAGLAQAAEALERLSHVFSKRRRRSRRSARPAGPHVSAPEGADTAAEAASSSAEASDESFDASFDASGDAPADAPVDAPPEAPATVPSGIPSDPPSDPQSEQ